MLILLTIYALSRCIIGASLSVPVATGTPPALSDSTQFAAGAGNHPLRTRYTILQTCILTLFACIWQSSHPNMLGPRHSGFHCLLRKARAAFLTLGMPELVLYYALRQRFEAKKIADLYNREFIGNVAKSSLRKTIEDWFRLLPIDATRHDYVPPWTISHGFFIQMGGFILYQDNYPKQVLDYDRLAALLRSKSIDLPTISTRDLDDRSKGDAISKFIALVQTGWFILHCLVRLGQHLPLSELEVVTLASAVMNACIYLAWWDKPQGAGVAARLLLKESQPVAPHTSLTSNTSLKHSVDGQPNLATDDSTQTVLPHDNNIIPNDSSPVLSHTSPLHNHHSELGTERPRSLTADIPMNIIHVQDNDPITLARAVVRGLDKGFDTDETAEASPLVARLTNLSRPPEATLSVDVFAALGKADPWVLPMISIVATLFGAIHFLAWDSEFLTNEDKIIWRVSAVGMTCLPILYLLSPFSSGWVGGTAYSSKDIVLFLYLCASALIFPICASMRLAITVVSLQAIENPPQAVLIDVRWTSLIPHL
ncbi:hypothetical protein D9619_011281 [Psilocybe cf. subviscida]|uniref:Uncharacterized protein n=1 Tax=Psilocybe cf. subviscida TaxID=2480587 RepID=A0A8H5BJA2_9AGAR|nr:hypothetical protein D9619_011281 [Psilocybe cf. subviscida]